MGQVIIGMDPHKRSATIEIINDREKVLAQGRFGTDRDGYRTMLKLGRQHRERVWAVEGCNGIGRHIAQRLVADGETVVDVPAKLSARAIGEGFDAPALDTLFLAGPISYDGLLVQCAGRVIRAAPGKDLAEVHDYHDPATPILAASLPRRMPGYRALGFTRT
ncbi:transposase [Micromonospora sp. NPDC052213]|uniref:IS110 family transposase n=1 Tax=Micromonospora sp. NPDC052213 TaxID=3155812 RepID=UPI003445550A